MKHKPTKNPDDKHFRVLSALARNPMLKQRETAVQLGMSTSGLNHVLHALIDKGLVKVRNFVQSSKRLGYAYLLTPQGVAKKTQLTKGFVTRKLAERAVFEAEIQEILMVGDDLPAGVTDRQGVLLSKN